ncbi:hypothetical protein MKEN_01170700 [Mycena kentingensis (nom. inval.)]|nr:hypothetical protein MKEN_01170700 [Mycena kentingensis (nom. inval.)]
MAGTSARLPQEIIDSLLDAVSDRPTLKRCALVARSFRYNSQKSLFSSLTVSTPSSSLLNPPPTLDDLCAIFSASPHLALHVRSLKLYSSGTSEPEWMQSVPFAQLLYRFVNLTQLDVVNGFMQVNWQHLVGGLKPALIAVTSLPTLTRLSLRNIEFGTRGELQELIQNRLQLRTLSLNFVTVGPARSAETAGPSTRLALESLTMDPFDGRLLHCIADQVYFTGLRDLKITLDARVYEELAQSRIIAHAENIEKLRLIFWHDITGNSPIDLSRLARLHTLKITFPLLLIEHHADYAPWIWANDVLSSALHANTSPLSLRQLTLNITVDELDPFSALRRLSLLQSNLCAWRDAISPSMPSVIVRMDSDRVDFSVDGSRVKPSENVMLPKALKCAQVTAGHQTRSNEIDCMIDGSMYSIELTSSHLSLASIAHQSRSLTAWTTGAAFPMAITSPRLNACASAAPVHAARRAERSYPSSPSGDTSLGTRRWNL